MVQRISKPVFLELNVDLNEQLSIGIDCGHLQRRPVISYLNSCLFVEAPIFTTEHGTTKSTASDQRIQQRSLDRYTVLRTGFAYVFNFTTGNSSITTTPIT
ncbi:hypothetical protein EG68_02010 [Paragonimus skrjabini miyazakii]|uniref:Uncharacterized protein n=1 Tax=Paragonimus skrjabini miyazakii TaxID=59628 RepID=A0A8S9Z5J1_9TREM|nr:hypothetical protein EG68_02010 [Paragonimus skrjabini miyazakii]